MRSSRGLSGQPDPGKRGRGSLPDHSTRLWALDKTAYWSERVGDVLAAPWYRLSRWASERWRAYGEIECPACHGVPQMQGDGHGWDDGGSYHSPPCAMCGDRGSSSRTLDEEHPS